MIVDSLTWEERVERYVELARYELQREYVTDERGQLSDAFDGELFHALRTLGLICADEAKSNASVLLAVDAFRNAVNVQADQYAAPRVMERARGMAGYE
jgi:hypothetical protein